MGVDDASADAERALAAALADAGRARAASAPSTAVVAQRCASAHCCARCTLRFLELEAPRLFRYSEAALARALSSTFASSEVQANARNDSEATLCQLCFGALQDAGLHAMALEIGSKLVEYETDAEFKLTVGLPPASLIREHVFLKELCAATTADDAKTAQRKTISLRLAFKWALGYLIETQYALTFSAQSAFFVSVNLDHDESNIETLSLFDSDARERERKRAARTAKRKQLFKNNMDRAAPTNNGCAEVISAFPSFNAIEATLQKLPADELRTAIPFKTLDEMATVQSPAKFSVALESAPVFIRGRYNKYSRKLSQTPWLQNDDDDRDQLDLEDKDNKDDVPREKVAATLNGMLPGGECVETFILPALKALLRADEAIFSSTGREDVDVRMLGEGRPFVVELRNSKRVRKLCNDELRSAERSINAGARGLIRTRALQLTNAADVAQERKRSSEKRKRYRCVIVLTREPTKEELGALSAQQSVVLKQRTPVRVLHRRSALTRTRTIYTMSAKSISRRCILLDVEAESGTYIKEFVHGDFGRTSPSVGELLRCGADIVQLDVLEVLDSVQ